MGALGRLSFTPSQKLTVWACLKPSVRCNRVSFKPCYEWLKLGPVAPACAPPLRTLTPHALLAPVAVVLAIAARLACLACSITLTHCSPWRALAARTVRASPR